MIITIIGPGPEPDDNDFDEVQNELDRSQWTGRGPRYSIPGGWNDLKEHDLHIGETPREDY